VLRTLLPIVSPTHNDVAAGGIVPVCLKIPSRLAGLRPPEGGDFLFERNHLDVFGTFFPIVNPTNNDVAACGIVAVVAEVAAHVFEFDADGLPGVGWDEAFGFAVGVAGFQGLDDEAEVARHEGEEEEDAGFIYRGVAQALERDARAAHSPPG